MARGSGAGSPSDDPSLKRLGGGRWQTRDERFAIEPQSGTWVVVDAEQTDDLGLPLVRGPFRSLGDAKEAIAHVRSGPPATSPLADRMGRPAVPTDAGAWSPADRTTRRSTRPVSVGTGTGGTAAKPPPEPRPAAAVPAPAPAPAHAGRSESAPEEPRWLLALDPGPRRQARRLIARLEQAGAPDPEGMARRDIVGEVPAVAAFAIERRLAELSVDAEPDAIVRVLADGRDDELGVRWRVVDGDGRPITIDPPGRIGTSARARR